MSTEICLHKYAQRRYIFFFQTSYVNCIAKSGKRRNHYRKNLIPTRENYWRAYLPPADSPVAEINLPAVGQQARKRLIKRANWFVARWCVRESKPETRIHMTLWSNHDRILESRKTQVQSNAGNQTRRFDTETYSNDIIPGFNC